MIKQLRGFLHVSAETKTVVERYSDSAGAYVVLDPSNPSVYKQLFRAAKAKQKLKLRVSTIPNEIEEPTLPKPVTVEDEPEAELEPAGEKEDASKASEAEPSVSDSSALAPNESTETIAAPQAADQFPEFIKEWRARGMPRIHLRRDNDGKEVIDFLGQASSAEPMVTVQASSHTSLPVNGQYCSPQSANTLSFFLTSVI
jgi:next to BRCA1 gene 1 protein